MYSVGVEWGGGKGRRIMYSVGVEWGGPYLFRPRL